MTSATTWNPTAAGALRRALLLELMQLLDTRTHRRVSPTELGTVRDGATEAAGGRDGTS